MDSLQRYNKLRQAVNKRKRLCEKLNELIDRQKESGTTDERRTDRRLGRKQRPDDRKLARKSGNGSANDF